VPWGPIYNASKAAVNNLADTLRIEMELLGAKAILVCASPPPPTRISGKFQETTALVKSHFLQNLHTTSTLPETSVYSPEKSIIDPWMSGKRAVDVSLNVEVYAETFVENVLSKRLKARYWSAANSAAVWAVERVLRGGVVCVSSRLLILI
jgi:1-acylglycerone phosphate reductase